jgi:hypothetical protein
VHPDQGQQARLQEGWRLRPRGGGGGGGLSGACVVHAAGHPAAPAGSSAPPCKLLRAWLGVACAALPMWECGAPHTRARARGDVQAACSLTNPVNTRPQVWLSSVVSRCVGVRGATPPEPRRAVGCVRVRCVRVCSP